jgi:dihydroneopterin aldolase
MSSSAFDHPEARAIATAPKGVHDRLSLRDHIVSVEIGAFQAERDMLQRLSFDVVVEVSAPDADLEDDVDKILSYDRITWAIEHELAAERLNLLETLAERIADRILQEPQAMRVFVRIQKLDKGNGALGVEIERVPGQGGAQASDLRAPVVCFMPQEAVGSDLLDVWIAQLTSRPEPVVLCLDLPDTQERLGQARAQLNFDLLAIEQAAWKLAARFEDLTVAGTRTELDWAMKNGQTIVWAPSKLVLDATDTPEPSPAHLALWFAQQWGASELICFGDSLPMAHTIPTQTVTLDQSEI